MEVVFDVERETKNTVRFQENMEQASSEDTPKIGTLYVQKSTLKQLGYKDGSQLIVTLDVR